MTTPLYLTPHAARLVKEFTLELRTGGPLFVLYGDPCTGKTRILHELCERQQPETNARWIELSARESGDDNKQDRSELVEAIFDQANDGDIIVADHFESAFNKTRHQLFLSWSTTGVEKNIKLIIACNNAISDDLEQLVRQYQLQAEVYQLMPYNDQQVEEFLGIYLFPDHPGEKLIIPGELRVQFALTHGKVGKIIEIAERERERIKLESQAEPESQVGPESIRQHSRMVAALGASVLVLAVGWFLLIGDEDTAVPTPEAVADSASLVASIGQVSRAGIMAETETGVNVETETGSMSESESNPNPASTVPKPSTTEVGDELEVGILEEKVRLLEQEILILEETEIETEPDTGIDSKQNTTAQMPSTGEDENGSEVLMLEEIEIPVRTDSGIVSTQGATTQTPSQAEAVIGSETGAKDETEFAQKPIAVNEATGPSPANAIPESEAILAPVAESEPDSTSDNLVETQEQPAITPEPVAVTEASPSEAAIVDSTASVGGDDWDGGDGWVEERIQDEMQRLHRQLEASMDWIYNNEDGVGTIQILLLSYDKFNPKGFYEHVDYLASQQVDTSKLKIVKTYTGNRIAYSVFYGEYESRDTAGKAKKDLPEVLRKTAPIPRSVGGIMQEIRRLEAMN